MGNKIEVPKPNFYPTISLCESCVAALPNGAVRGKCQAEVAVYPIARKAKKEIEQTGGISQETWETAAHQIPKLSQAAKANDCSHIGRARSMAAVINPRWGNDAFRGLPRNDAPSTFTDRRRQG